MSSHNDNCNHCPVMAAIISHAVVHATDEDLRHNGNYVRLKKELERQAILTTEYRRSFFAIIELLGDGIFKLVADRHRQRDALLEAEAAKTDEFIERIKHAAD